MFELFCISVHSHGVYTDHLELWPFIVIKKRNRFASFLVVCTAYNKFARISVSFFFTSLLFEIYDVYVVYGNILRFFIKHCRVRVYLINRLLSHKNDIFTNLIKFFFFVRMLSRPLSLKDPA